MRYLKVFAVIWLVLLVLTLSGQAVLAQTSTPKSSAEPTEPFIQVLDAGDGKQIILRTTQATLEQNLLLLESSGSSAAQGMSVTLALGQLRADNNATAQLQITPTNYILIPGQAQKVTISGNLPEPGAYAGFFTVSFNNAVNIYNLNVTRAPATSTITLRASTARSVQRWLPWFTSDIDVRVALTENSGGKAFYYRPILQKLTQPAPGTTDGNDANFKEVQTTAKDNSALPVSQTLTLQPGQVAEYNLKIKDVATGGQHQGTVEIATPDGAKVAGNFSFSIKDAFLLPMLVICFGILTSSFVRYYSTNGRPRLRRVQQISRMAGKVAENLTADDMLYSAFQARLQNLYEENQDGTLQDVTTEVTTLTSRLENYLYIRKILALKVNLPSYISDSAKQAETLNDFRDIELELQTKKLEALDAGSNSAKERAQNLYAKLMQLANQNVADKLQKLSANLKASQQGLENYLQTLGRGQVVQGLAQLKADFEQLSQDVQALSEKNNTTTDLADKEKIGSEVKAQLDRYDNLLLTSFRVVLQVTTVPPGFIAPDWEALRTELLNETTSPENLNTAQIKLMRRLLDGLRQEISKVRNSLTAILGKEQNVAEMDALLARLDKAQVALASDPAASRDEYVALVRDFISTGQSGLMGSAGSLNPSVPVQPPTVPMLPIGASGGQLGSAVGTLRPIEEVKIEIPKFTELSARLLFGDGIAFSIMVLVTILLGLQLLWAGKETFGTWEDYIGVFLWGFGLHQLNQVALPSQVNTFNVPLSPTALANANENPKPVGKP